MNPGASIASPCSSHEILPFDEAGDRKLRVALLSSIGALIIAAHIGLAMLPMLWLEEPEQRLEAVSEQPRLEDIRLHLFAVMAAAMAEETERRAIQSSVAQRVEAAPAAGSPVTEQAATLELGPDHRSAPSAGVDEARQNEPEVAGRHTSETSIPVTGETEEGKADPPAIGPSGVAVEVPSPAESDAAQSAAPDRSAAVAGVSREAAPEVTASSRVQGQTRAKARPAQTARVKARQRAGSATQAPGAKAVAPVADRIQYRSVFE